MGPSSVAQSISRHHTPSTLTNRFSQEGIVRMTILLASSNPHKIEEILAIWLHQGQAFESPPIDMVTLNQVDPDQAVPEPVEDQATFEANAALKARYYASAFGLLTLADDSGLEVDALGGRPGVYSARWAGVTGKRQVVDQANNDRLLHELIGVPDDQRTARFVCAMALCAPQEAVENDPHHHGDIPQSALGTEVGQIFRLLASVRGTLEGRIIGGDEQPSGEHGFGYDPLFIASALNKTTSEMLPQEKNAISHRGQAARLMWQRFQDLGLHKA